MTKPTESLASQMNRLDHAIELKLIEIILDGMEAIVSSESRAAKKGE